MAMGVLKLTFWHAVTKSSSDAPALVMKASTRSLNSVVNCSYSTVYLHSTEHRATTRQYANV